MNARSALPHLASLAAATALAFACSACSSPKPEDEGAPPGAGAGNAAAADAGAHDAADGSSDSSDGSVDADASFPFDVNACSPELPPGFQPVTVTPLVNKVCTSTQIADFIQSCLGMDTSTCPAWTQDPSNDQCFHHCIVSPYAATPATPGTTPPPPAASWGPIIDTQNPGATTWFNVSACIALADPTKSKCAEDLNQRFQCEYAACTANCPIPPNDSSQGDLGGQSQWDFDYQNCTQSADYGPCQAYSTSVSTDCTISTPDGGPAAFCFSVAGGGPGAFTQLITQQCGM